MNMVMFHKGIAGGALIALHQQHERNVEELAFYTICRWGASRTSISGAIMRVVCHGSKAAYGEQVMHQSASNCQELLACTFSSVMD